MYRLITCVALLFATSCARHRDLSLTFDQVSLDRLSQMELDETLARRKQEYSRAEEAQKPYLALTLGYIYFLKKQTEQATPYFKEVAATHFPLQSYGLFYNGKIALFGNRCSEAKLGLDELERKHPTSLSLERLADAYRLACEPKVVSTPKTQKERIQKIRGDLYESAVQSYNDKDYKNAILQFKIYLRRVKSDHPHVEDALIKLSIIYKRLDQKEDYLKMIQTLSQHRKAHKKFPYNPKWLYEVARHYWNTEHISLTKRELLRLIGWPYHRYVGKSYYILARIEAEHKEYEKALEHLSKATQHVVDSDLGEQIAYLRGWYAYKLASHEKAVEAFSAFRTSFPLSDYFLTVSYWLGKTYLKTGDLGKAKSIFNEIIQKNPNSYYAIRSFYQLKDQRKKIQFKNKLTLSHLDSEPFRNAVQLIHLGLGEDGIEELASAVPFKELKQMPIHFQFTVAALYSFAGDHISSFIILNDLEDRKRSELPNEYLQILYPRRYWDLITKYAKQFQLDPYLLLSIMRQESAFDPNAISPADAYGLLQMTPAMARGMGTLLGVPLNHKNELLDPDRNILYCSYYLSTLIKEYRGNLVLALATYNANHKAVKKWKERYWVDDPEEFIEEIPYQETRNYVKLILRNYTNSIFVHEKVFRVFPEALTREGLQTNQLSIPSTSPSQVTLTY